MYNFEYITPDSMAQTTALLREHPESRLLAGGMTFIPSMKHRLVQPSHVIDLRRISELQGISCTPDHVEIGAMTRHFMVASSSEVRAAIPALASLANGIGDPQVRNRGTLGGSLANNDPAADYPSAALALGATFVTDRRKIKADDFFIDLFETLLEPDEIIRSVRFPVPLTAGYAKFRHPASRYAIVGVFVARFKADTRVAVTGAGPCVFRCKPLEEALGTRFSPDAVDTVSIDHTELNGDIHASAQYRAQLIKVMARQAVETALSKS